METEDTSTNLESPAVEPAVEPSTNAFPTMWVAQSSYVKRHPADILEDAKKLDLTLIARQVLQWTEKNIENFIDSYARQFKLDMVIESSETLAELKKLQDYFRALPDQGYDSFKAENPDIEIAIYTDDELNTCTDYLFGITEEIKDTMMKQDDLLSVLFKRMAFYYEMTSIKSDGSGNVHDLVGSVAINHFEYEAVNVGVRVTSKIGGEVAGVKEYQVEEGFAVWLEISFKDNDRPVNLF